MNEKLKFVSKGNEIHLILFVTVTICSLILFWDNNFKYLVSFTILTCLSYLLIFRRKDKFYDLTFTCSMIVVKYKILNKSVEYEYTNIVKIKHQVQNAGPFGQDDRYFFYLNDMTVHTKNGPEMKNGLRLMQDYFKKRKIELKKSKTKNGDILIKPCKSKGTCL